MIEIKGNLWDFHIRRPFVVCVTTNGTVKNNGRLVMGRGCAAEAVLHVPGVDLFLGTKISVGGNKPYWVNDYLLSFPVKHHWSEPASIDLIERSANFLRAISNDLPGTIFVLPRPGCGYGRLTWDVVKPILAPILLETILVISKPEDS